MSEKPIQTTRITVFTFVALISLMVLYVLSVGPVFLLYCLLIEDRNSAVWNDWGDALRAIYSPLTVLSGKAPAFGTAMNWYMEQWLNGWEVISGQHIRR